MTLAPRPSLLEAYSGDRPILLLTDYAPDTEGGGAVILRSLLGPGEADRLVWLSLAPPRRPESVPFRSQALQAGSAGRGARSIGLDTIRFAKGLAREVLQVARERNAAAIWAVMHNAAVPVARHLVEAGVLPVHLTVHDDPAFANALRSKRYLLLTPIIERDFARALRRADSVDVIGEAMARRYRSRYRVESTVIHRALDAPVEPPGEYDAGRFGLRVGVLGSTYAYGQLPLLARAVEAAAERLGVAGRILMVGQGFGDRLKAEFAGRVEVEVTGHIDEAAAIPRLRDCFALYLNYPFGRRDRVLRQTSFPTKLSTYVQAARPILIQTPIDGSTRPLTERRGYAISWPSLDPRDGSEALVGAWSDPAFHRGREAEAEAVRLAYYNPAENRSRLAEVLNRLPRPGGGS